MTTGTLTNCWTALARGRVVLALAAVAIAVFAATHIASFPGTVSYFHHVTGGQTILDLRASSSAEETWQRLDAMGDAGRAAYLRLIAIVDVVFPLSVALALVALARFSARRLALRRAFALGLVALPIAYLALDFTENLVVLRLLLAFPAKLTVEGEIVGWLTRAKRIAEVAALVVPPVMLGVNAIRLRIAARSTDTAARVIQSR